ncbi:MAG: signal peptide peptidase SppA [Bacteroidaceae bacterium]|nr:signal peptide peptidase SppA [Bacteroidaceae bacterium]
MGRKSNGGTGCGVVRFLMNVLSSCLGFTIGMIVFAVLTVVVICVIVLSDGSGGSIKPDSVVEIQLAGIVSERDNDDALTSVIGESDPTVSLEKTLNAIKLAKDDDNIKGISIKAGVLLSDPASLDEIRNALVDFKKSGKFVYAYADHYTQGAYFVCSAADRVVLNPIGELDWKGLGATTVYYTDLLAKLGIKMQVFKVGSFKSAVEPYTRTEMSEENRRQVKEYVGDIWQNMVTLVSKSRGIAPSKLEALADQYMGLAQAEDLKKCGLVDTLLYADQYDDMLKRKLRVDIKEDLNKVSTTVMCESVSEMGVGHAVAVVYMEGEIVDYKEMGFGAESVVDTKTMRNTIKKLIDDDEVKAVVLRINSGGGSAYASEQIWHMVKKLAGKKPVVVSMGGMAASGAYYIASAADKIVAQPTTLTGSIGIFGLVPDVSELLGDKLGLKYDVVKTNELSDLGNVSRPFNEAESRLMQNYVENGYGLFLKRVAEGRKKTPAQVDSIAQGRVWTGSRAMKLGLVDKLGSLEDAIALAASRGKIKGEYDVRYYPESVSWFESLSMSETEARLADKQLRQMLGDYYEVLTSLRFIRKQDRVQARIPYIIKVE